jgi:hypothetical protein
LHRKGGGKPPHSKAGWFGVGGRGYAMGGDGIYFSAIRCRRGASNAEDLQRNILIQI